MVWLAMGIYLSIHFFVYVIFFRHQPLFRTEKGILLFQVVPIIAVLLIATAAFLILPSNESFALIFGLGALHALYSLSFLEVWVLSEGGYSLRILAEIVRLDTVTAAEIEEQFIPMSARKKGGRLETLITLGLVKPSGAMFVPTFKGLVLSRVAAFLASLSRSKSA